MPPKVSTYHTSTPQQPHRPSRYAGANVPLLNDAVYTQAKPTPPVPEGESAITHLECALEGDRYEAGVLQGLSKAMKPLLVKYDYEKAKKTLTRAALAARPNTMWKWREILPVTKTENCVYLGEECVPTFHP